MVDPSVLMSFFLLFADVQCKQSIVQGLIEAIPDSVSPELVEWEKDARSLIEQCDLVFDRLDFSNMNLSK